MSAQPLTAALYIEGPRNLQFSERERDRIADTLRLAATLDGDAFRTLAARSPLVSHVGTTSGDQFEIRVVIRNRLRDGDNPCKGEKVAPPNPSFL
jgi:hypothetical protein